MDGICHRNEQAFSKKLQNSNGPSQELDTAFRLLTASQSHGLVKEAFLHSFSHCCSSHYGAHGDAMVTGTVFCDQCKDGQISLFDYPSYGVKVTMACPGSDGQFTTWGEETTNWVGNYAMRFEGTPNLSGCYTQVSGTGQGSNGCGAVAGPPKYVRLMFDMFDTEMYTVDPLLAQPAQPMSFCPKAATPNPVAPSNPPLVMPPPAPQQPPLPRSSVATNASSTILGSFSLPIPEMDDARIQMLLEGGDPGHESSCGFRADCCP
ncbi:UNVERIFIED_CONTAM: hypothetical protein Sradi_4673500 [Sesamum radiatum]|uniref:Uncharacterized protein n=1 Tax=Sesamum radiatum TaxID=300843 RepID=A0AAW2MX41_SESRA